MRLPPAQRAALEAIDAGQSTTGISRRTLIALWHRGLIADSADNGPAGVRMTRLQLTPYGRQALRTGRILLSRRRGPA